ncbi:MAG: hypothetical protein WCH04_11195 [Gammaproteobacteria bacterium]
MREFIPVHSFSGSRTCTDVDGGASGLCCLGKPMRSLFMLVGILGVGGAMGTAHATPFNPPSLDGYSLADEHDADGDGDGVKETHVQQYFNPDGDSIYSMTTNGQLWAWSLETKGESTGGPLNYVIRDSDCDGVFDEVYSLEDKYYLPDCVK